MPRPLEGYDPMSDSNEQLDETQETADAAAEENVEETTETADTDHDDGDTADESEAKPPEGGKDDGFDRRRAEAKIRKANSEAANLRKRLKELEPLAKRAKELEDADKTEAERLQGQLAEAEKRIATLRDRAVISEVRALAADGFADKTDPEALLDLSTYVDESGEIDTARIESDLVDLLERKPHLGKPKTEPERKRPAPDRTQASSANKPTSQDPGDMFAGFVKSRLK